MIDWRAATSCAAALIARPPADLAAAITAAAGGAPLQNRAFPLSPLPVTLQHAAADEHAGLAERYVRLLNRIIGLYQDDSSVRAWFGLDPAAERLVAADQRLGGDVLVCRLDGYLEQATEKLTLLENNADAPAGSLFTARVNAAVRDLLDRLSIPAGQQSPLTYSCETAVLEVLETAAKRAGADAPARVAVIQPSGSATVESEQMVSAFAAAGVEAFLADPRDIAVCAGRVRFAGRPADACWNKINTAPWRLLLADDPDLEGRWIQAVADTPLIHVNPFGARYVAESKLSLALPQEPRFAGHFTPAERELAGRLLPWSRKVDADAVSPDGARPLIEDLYERPADFVLKEPYDIRGDGVTIGRLVPRRSWDVAVGRAARDGHLAQAYVAPTAYPVVRAGVPEVVAMPMSLDTYVLSGTVRGFGSKAGLGGRVNVFQGGQKLAVHVLSPRGDGARAS